jgi:hypothetical protein
MIINFNKDYQKRYNIDLKSEHYLYDKIHTTAPIFIDAYNIEWFEEFYNLQGFDHFDDFLFLNILGIKLEMDKRMLVMPPYSFTQIHHYGLKPVTGIIKKGDKILSGTEERIYMSHGKYFDKGWKDDLMKVMNRYFKDENLGKRQREQAEKSKQILINEFNKYLNM